MAYQSCSNALIRTHPPCPVNQPSNKQLPHFPLCSSLTREALIAALTSFLGGMGKGTARNSVPPTLANADLHVQRAMPGVSGVADEKTEPYVTNWGLQEQALKWSLGMQHIHQGSTLAREEGGSRAGQRSVSQSPGSSGVGVGPHEAEMARPLHPYLASQEKARPQAR